MGRLMSIRGGGMCGMWEGGEVGEAAQDSFFTPQKINNSYIPSSELKP